MLVDIVKQLNNFVKDKRLGDFGLELTGSFIVERNGDGTHLRFNGDIVPYHIDNGPANNPIPRSITSLNDGKQVYESLLQHAGKLLDGKKYSLKPGDSDRDFEISVKVSPEELKRELEAIRELLGEPKSEVYPYSGNEPSSTTD